MVSGIIVAFYSDRNLHIFDSVIYYFHINIALGFEFIIFCGIIGSQAKTFKIPFYQRRRTFRLISAIVQASVTVTVHIQLDSESIFMIYCLLHYNSQPCLFSFGSSSNIKFFLSTLLAPYVFSRRYVETEFSTGSLPSAEQDAKLIMTSMAIIKCIAFIEL